MFVIYGAGKNNMPLPMTANEKMIAEGLRVYVHEGHVRVDEMVAAIWEAMAKAAEKS